MDSHIYGLADPISQHVRYIGRTIQSLEKRLREHIGVSRRKSQCAKSLWIRSLLIRGLTPEIFEIETVPLERSQEAEGIWMQYFRYVGADLLNEQSHNVGGFRTYIIEWTNERIAKLGTIPDEEYALELGVDRKTIEYKRNRLGIAKCGVRPDRKSPPPPMGGWNRKELPEQIVLRLGTMPDYLLANEIGVAKAVIARARRERGIPDWSVVHNDPTKFKAGQLHPRWDKAGKRIHVPEHLVSYLGQISDAELSEIANVPRSVVERERKQRGIPARSRKGNPKRKKGGRSLCLE